MQRKEKQIESAKPLTKLAIEKAKPREKPYRLRDSKGLYLWVTPSGGKLWRWKYRHQGKQKLMTFDPWPEMSLAEAREKRDDMRKLLRSRVDPMAERKAEKQAQREQIEHSFRAVALEWHTHWKQGRSPRHAGYVLRRLEADILPKLGSRPIAEIDSPEVIAMLRAISDRGVADLAKRALQVTSAVFRYAKAHKIPCDNPCTDFRPGDVLPSTTCSGAPR